MTDDDIIQLIETFDFDAGPVAVERRNRGFTLIHAETGVPIARLRPIGRDDLVDILYWSLWKERWMPFGPFGRTAAPVEQACASSRKHQSFGPASETSGQKSTKSR
jgi:hypothetical protein